MINEQYKKVLGFNILSLKVKINFVNNTSHKFVYKTIEMIPCPKIYDMKEGEM